MISVARFYKVSRARFDADRGGLDADWDSLRLPCRATAGSAGYDFFAPADFTLAPGETLAILAHRFGTTVRILRELNDITDAEQVKPGVPIMIPQR